MTTNGRKLIAKCMATEQPLKLTRVAIGSGTVEPETDLVQMQALLEYVADGEIAQRSHEENRLNLTIQYANNLHKTVPLFYLSEFLLYAEDPESGAEIALLYATLGDYKQPVPAYAPGQPGSVFQFPLTLVLSSDLSVEIATAPGLITYDQLESSVQEATKAAMEELQPGWAVYGIETITIPREDWEKATPETEDYSYFCDVISNNVTDSMIPIGTPLPGNAAAAGNAGMSSGCTAGNGFFRFFAQQIPERDISCQMVLLRMRGAGDVGNVDPGVGLGFGTDGRLNVLLGSGMTVDDSNQIEIDRETVLTQEDLIDETSAEQSLKEILQRETTPEESES